MSFSELLASYVATDYCRILKSRFMDGYKSFKHLIGGGIFRGHS